LLQHGTDSSKSPALLSLLLSSVKQLQHSCQGSAQGALAAAGLTGVVGDLTVELYKLCVTFRTRIAGPAGASSSAAVGLSADSSISASGTGAALEFVLSSTGAAAPGVLEFNVCTTAPDDRNPGELSAAEAGPSTGASRVFEFSISTTAAADHSTQAEPLAAETAPSTEPALPPGAALATAAESAEPAGGEEPPPGLTAEGTSRVAHTWLVLLSRALFTAGVAMQTIAAGAGGTSVAGSSSKKLITGSAPTSPVASLAGLSRGLQKYAGLAGMFMESDAAASAVARRKKSGTVQVLLPGAPNPAIQPCRHTRI
jgi:hypothetical protein